MNTSFSLEGRVIQLEKLVVTLAKWTKLSLNLLGPLQDAAKDVDDIKLFGKPCQNTSKQKTVGTKRVAKNSTCGILRKRGNISTTAGETDGNEKDTTIFPSLTYEIAVTPPRAVKVESCVDFDDFFDEGNNSNNAPCNNSETETDDGNNDDGAIFPDDVSNDYNISRKTCDGETIDANNDGGRPRRKKSIRIQNKKDTSVGHRRNVRYKVNPQWKEYKALKVPQTSSETILNGPVVLLDNMDKAELKRRNVPIIKRYQRKISPKSYNCHKCAENVGFKYKSELDQHMNLEHGGKYDCDRCDEKFPTKLSLTAHQKTHKIYPRLKKKPLERPCPFCPKVYYHKNHYATHVRVHTKEKPYLCFICGFTTKNVQTLNQHMTLRHDTALQDPANRPFKCEDCDRTFKIAPMLKIHKRKMHTPGGKVQYPCKQCTGAFSDSGKLKRHVRDVHEDVRALQCPRCDQTFKRNSHLKKHLLNHDNPNRRQRRSQHKPFLKWAPRLPLQEEASETSESSSSKPIFEKAKVESSAEIENDFQDESSSRQSTGDEEKVETQETMPKTGVENEPTEDPYFKNFTLELLQ